MHADADPNAAVQVPAVFWGGIFECTLSIVMQEALTDPPMTGGWASGDRD